MTENKPMEEGGLSALFELPGKQPVLEDGFQDAGKVELDALTYSPEDIDKFLSEDTEKVVVDSMAHAQGLPRVGVVGHQRGMGLQAMMATALAANLDSHTIVAPPFDDSLIPNLNGMPLGSFHNLLPRQRMTVGASASSKKKRKAKKQARKKSRK